LQPAGPETGVFQPRRVQTVTIGPDGSVVSEQAPVPAGLEGAGAETRELARLIDPGAGEAPSAVVPEPAAEPEPVAADPVGGTLRAGAERLNPPLREDAQETLFAPSPRPKPRPTARLASVQPGAAERPQIPASATNAAAARALEGFAVQVASHRKQAEAVAAFADLQQRFPSLISGYQPLIQRADLGERGIFFRLRIGPVATKSDADRLCDSLKGAGLPACLVRAL
jgi:cell division septation protein DedD